MKYKFVILMALVALLSISLVAANYDLQVSSVVVDPASPINGYAASVTVNVQNNGPDNIASESITLDLDFDDSTSTSFSITDLNAGDDLSFTNTHTWTTSQDYNINATVSGMLNDSNPNTDFKIKTITVINPSIVLSSADLTVDPSYRSTSISENVAITNNGNVQATITNAYISDLDEVSGTESIDNALITVNAPSTIDAGASEDVSLTIPIASTVKPATYTGILTVVYPDETGSTVTEVSDVTVVVDNRAPTVDAISNQIIIIGSTFSYNVVANDVEGDTLSYSLTGAPTGMTIDNVTGVIDWTPTLATTATVNVLVNDGYDTTTESFVIESKADAPGLTASETAIVLGSSSTDRSTQVSETYTVQNTGTQTITDITAELLNNAGSTLSTDYAASAVISATTLNPGEFATVSVSATIPIDQDSKRLSIGKVKVSGNGASTSVYQDTTLQMEAKSYLRIADVKIEVNNDDTEDMSDGENYDKIKEGDEVVVTIKLENIYSSSDNIKIKNSYAQLTDDNDWDVDEESSDIDIKEDDYEKVEVRFTVPDSVDDDTTIVTIEAYGEDEEEGFNHYDEFSFELEIDRPRNEISIVSWNFDRDPVSCNDAYATLNVKIKNTGTDDQSEAAILVQSDSNELDWYKRITDIELNESDSETLSFNIPVRNADEGSYFVEITSYYDNTKNSDNEVTSIEVDCATSTPTTPTTPTVPGGSIVVTPPTNPTTPTTPSVTPSYGEPVSATESFRNSNSYFIILIIVVVVLLLVVIGFVANMLTRK